MKKQVEEKLCTVKRKLCIYCNSIFSETKTFDEPLQRFHSLCPVTQTQNSEGKLPQESVFGGTVQTYFLEANGDFDFLHFMVVRKQLIDEFIEEDIQAEPKKMQPLGKVNSEKPALVYEDAIDLTIHVSSKMETVCRGERLTEEAFFTMLDELLSDLFSFIPHGK